MMYSECKLQAVTKHCLLCCLCACRLQPPVPMQRLPLLLLAMRGCQLAFLMPPVILRLQSYSEGLAMAHRLQGWQAVLHDVGAGK
jgi:hypothetical protein